MRGVSQVSKEKRIAFLITTVTRKGTEKDDEKEEEPGSHDDAFYY